MTSRDFCYWLQGFLELAGEQTALDAKQTECMRRHLELVFKHEIDPSFGDALKELKKLHDPHGAGRMDPNVKIMC